MPAEAAFSDSSAEESDTMVPPGTAMTLEQLRAAAAQSPAVNNNVGEPATSPSSGRSEASSSLQEPSVETTAQHARPLAEPISVQKPAGAQNRPSVSDLMADTNSRLEGNGDRVPLNPADSNMASAEAGIPDEAGHRAASKAFMDSVAGNVGAAARPASVEEADSEEEMNGFRASQDEGPPSSSNVVSLDDIIADIEQQEAEAGLYDSSTPSPSSIPDPLNDSQRQASAAQVEPSSSGHAESSLHLPGAVGNQPVSIKEAPASAVEPGMSRESQASTSYAAVAPVSEEAIPGTSAGQSREFQTSQTSTASEQSSSAHRNVDGFEVLLSPGVTGQQPSEHPGQPDATDAQSGQESSQSAMDPAPSGVADAAEEAASTEQQISSAVSDDSSRSREAQATTEFTAVTRAADESIPGTSDGQSREFQADSAVSGVDTSAASHSPSSSSQSAASESRTASTQPAVSPVLSTDIPDTSQSREVQAAQTSTPEPIASPDLTTDIPDTSQSREAKAAQNSTPEPAVATSVGPQRRPFREPAPLPASFRLKPSTPAPNLPSSEAASSPQSQALSSTPASSLRDIKQAGGSSSSSRMPEGNLLQSQEASSTSASSFSESEQAGTSSSSSSSSGMPDFAASRGAAPGSSPYERRAGSRGRSTSTAGPGAGQASSGPSTAQSTAQHESSSEAGPTSSSGPTSRMVSRREGSNVWDPSQPDFIGFPDQDRVVRGGDPGILWIVQSCLGQERAYLLL